VTVRPLPAAHFAALIVALVGYYLPFTAHKTAGLTMQAWDLAEFVGISPSVRYATPPMLAPGLLRAGLVALGVLFGLYAAHSQGVGRWGAAVIALALALTFLPPIEFFRGNAQDPNYLQLGTYAIVSGALLGLIAVLTLIRRVPPAWFGLIAAGIGAGVCWVGAVEARAVLTSPILRVSVDWGIGPVVYTAGILIGGILGLWRAKAA
jgi:hypothetical protein